MKSHGGMEGIRELLREVEVSGWFHTQTET
jgi:hypothetical protein